MTMTSNNGVEADPKPLASNKQHMDRSRPFPWTQQWLLKLQRSAGSWSGGWGVLLLGCAITVVFLWLLMRELDLAAFREALTRLSLQASLIALAFLTMGYTTRIIRWWWMLRFLDPQVPMGVCVWPFLTSISLNNVLPFRIGDGLRILGFRQKLKCQPMGLAGTLATERIMDLLVLCGFFFLGLLGLPEGAFPHQFSTAAAALAGFSMAGLLLLMVLLPQLVRYAQHLQKQSSLKKRQWLAAILAQGLYFAGALSIIRSSSHMLVLLMLSLISWGFEGAVFASVAADFHGHAAPLAPWFALATGTLATLLPSTPGYIGTFDYFAAQGLIAYGASPEAAAAFAIAVHGVLWVPLTSCGLIYLALQGTKR